MLQQAASRFLLLNRFGLQQAAAAAAAAGTSTCLQQHPFTQQWRGKSSSAEGPFSEAADPQHTSSGWSWFGSAQPAAASQPAADLPADSTAAAAGAGAADAAGPSEAAAAAMAAAPEAGLSAVESLTDQADLLMQVSSAAAEAAAAAARAECWLGTQKFMDVMFWVHDGWLGLPWCEAIVLANLFIKLAALPLTIIQQRNIPAMTNMRQDTQKLTEFSTKMAKAATAAEYGAYAVEFQKAQAEFNRKYHDKKKYIFLGPALAVTQGLVFISQFSAIGTLANAKLPAMTYEGALWFSNLTIPDPWFALPIICAAATMLQFSSKRFKDQMLAQGGDAAGPMQKILPFMGVFIGVAGCFQPSAIALLWASNSLISIGQNYLMWMPAFRAKVGLPPLAALTASASSSTGGFSDLWKQATGAASKQQQQPKPAEAVGAPPPGRLAVNYVASKPRTRRAKS